MPISFETVQNKLSHVYNECYENLTHMHSHDRVKLITKLFISAILVSIVAGVVSGLITTTISVVYLTSGVRADKSKKLDRSQAVEYIRQHAKLTPGCKFKIHLSTGTKEGAHQDKGSKAATAEKSGQGTIEAAKGSLPNELQTALGAELETKMVAAGLDAAEKLVIKTEHEIEENISKMNITMKNQLFTLTALTVAVVAFFKGIAPGLVSGAIVFIVCSIGHQPNNSELKDENGALAYLEGLPQGQLVRVLIYPKGTNEKTAVSDLAEQGQTPAKVTKEA